MIGIAPNGRRDLRGRVVLALAAALLLLLATGGHTLHTMWTFSRLADKRADHIHTIEELTQLASHVKDVETARRGFLLSNNEEYLSPYHQAVPRVHETLQGLRMLARDGRIAAAEWDRAEQAVTTRVRLAEESIARFRLVPEHDDAQREIGERGRISMAEARDAIQALIDAEQLELAATERAVRLQEFYALLAVAVGAVGGAAIIVFAIFALRLEMRRRAAAEAHARDTNERLVESVEALRLRNALILRLGELSHLLQGARDFPEALAILEERLPEIFPATGGALYLMRDSRDRLERGASWGGADSPQMLGPDECWALRKGFMHVVRPTERATRCAHHAEAPRGLSLCVPLVAHGEARGVLCLDYDAREAPRDEERDDVPACAEQIIVALSNLQLRDRLRNQAIRDPLSGLFNRRYLVETADRELSRARRADAAPVALVLMDIDHFKRFNDTHGHDAGDVVIQGVAEQLRKFVRGGDVAARHGGEEFVLWMPGARKADAARRAEALRVRVREAVFHHAGAQLPQVTLSLGVAAYPEDGGTLDALLKAADLALYAAKHAGRDRVVVAGDGAATAERADA